MSNFITLYRRIGTALADASNVILSDPGSNFGIIRLDNQQIIEPAATATTHPSTGIYQYDITALDPRYTYVASWQITSSYGTEWFAEAINQPGGTTRQTLRQESAKILGAFLASGAASSGNNVTLLDTSTSTNSILQSSLAANEQFKGGYLLMTGGANFGAWRQIADHATGTGQITAARAFAHPIAAGDTYEIYGLLTPDQWSDCIDVGLTRCNYITRSPLTLVKDGDMESNGTGDWTPTGCSVVKSVVESVTDGAQALLLIAAQTNCYAQSDDIRVVPNLGYKLWADYRCVSASLSTATCQIWDVTNNALIQAATDKDSGINFMGGLFEVGFTAPGNCYRVAVRLGAKEATAVVAFDDIILLCQAEQRYTLPKWFQFRNQYSTLQRRFGARPLSYTWTDMTWPTDLEEDPTAVVTFRVDLPLDGIVQAPFVRGERGYGPMDSTTDGALTACPEEWAIWHIAEAAHERYGKAISQADVGRQRVDRTDVAARVAQLDALYKPYRDARLGFTKPWLGTSVRVLP